MVTIVEWFLSLVHPIQVDPIIIQKNVKLMNSRDKWGMLSLLNSESMGGNAGNEGKYPCLGANFFYNPNTGKIKVFENQQMVPAPIQERYEKAIFTVAIDIQALKKRKQIKYKILSVNYRGKQPSSLVQKTIEDSITVYNQKYGFELE